VDALRAWIPMRDGVKLAARLWLPDERPAATLLEALPYRMDDVTSSYAADYERLCREGGFAVARVDIRGTGSSDGLAEDEYTEAEQADLEEVIAWLAAQEWSSGRVGMLGTSWSGFNSIQLAARRPPSLGGICAIYASDDRYTDDVHYTGGVLRAIDLVDYVLYMAAMSVLPPVPALVGEGWRTEWERRIESAEPWLLRWLTEQRDGPYWRNGSLRPGYERIECPTMLVAGWADGYRNNTFRTFEALRCPKALLIGPWSHASPATSLPGPHIDLVPELCRWFGRWLRDEAAVADADPPIRVFARRSTPPAPDLAEMQGEWRFEQKWPPDRLHRRVLHPDGAASDAIPMRGDVGVAAWNSCAGKLPWGQPLDQRPDDALSLTYEWDLDEELEIMGHPRLSVELDADSPVAFLSAKLCDVFPDGTSALVTRGMLNLTHRSSSTRPEPLAAGERVAIALELEATSWIFPPGHRLRLSLAAADWPNAWPPPHAANLAVPRESVALELPVLDGPTPVEERPVFAQAPGSALDSGHETVDAPVTWRIEHDVLGRETRAITAHGWDYKGEFGADVRERYEGSVGVSTEDPGRAWARGTARYEIRWPEASVSTEARLDLRSDAQTYVVTVDVIAAEEGGERRERRFERSIPRDLQ
jgi:putative CocE/NonD family hydrolase